MDVDKSHSDHWRMYPGNSQRKARKQDALPQKSAVLVDQLRLNSLM